MSLCKYFRNLGLQTEMLLMCILTHEKIQEEGQNSCSWSTFELFIKYVCSTFYINICLIEAVASWAATRSPGCEWRRSQRPEPRGAVLKPAAKLHPRESTHAGGHRRGGPTALSFREFSNAQRISRIKLHCVPINILNFLSPFVGPRKKLVVRQRETGNCYCQLHVTIQKLSPWWFEN